MALLIYSNGMDVRVATVRSADLLCNEGIDGVSQVEWEYCNENDYKEQVKRQNEIIKKLQEDNFAMHERITRAYQTLGGAA